MRFFRSIESLLFKHHSNLGVLVGELQSMEPGNFLKHAERIQEAIRLTEAVAKLIPRESRFLVKDTGDLMADIVKIIAESACSTMKPLTGDVQSAIAKSVKSVVDYMDFFNFDDQDFLSVMASYGFKPESNSADTAIKRGLNQSKSA